jgi:cytochrome c5
MPTGTPTQAVAAPTAAPQTKTTTPPTTPAPQSPASPPPAAIVRAGLPAGAGRETVQRVCTSCHAIGMVTAKGRTADGWSEIIGRMIGLGLEASDEDLQTVHAYLTRELPPR